MHGVNVVGFDGGLGGRQQAEREAGKDKVEQRTFHGRVASAISGLLFPDSFILGDAEAGRLVMAGPLSTLPNLSKREPWQGQSQVSSEWFQATMPPK